MTNIDQGELLPQTTGGGEKLSPGQILGWDLGKTLLANTLARGGNKIEVVAAKVSSSWAAEYVQPQSVEAPELQDQPVLPQQGQQIREVEKALLLAKQSLMVFASNHPEFNLGGGLAFPMDSLIQAGLTPEQIIGDKAALFMLAYFIKDSGKCFKRVSEAVFKNSGADKQTIVDTYEQTYDNLARTWNLPKFQCDAMRGFEKRLKWSKR